MIGRTHEIKGQAIAAFVTLKEGVHGTSELAGQLKAHVAHKIGAISRPDDILFTAELPKTRSGKIMRRLLRDIAEGRALGDTSTLADPSCRRQPQRQVFGGRVKMQMSELIFLVEEDLDGGYTARALGQSIFTEAETLENLRANIREAVECHFEEGQTPGIIRLHMVRDEVLAA